MRIRYSEEKQELGSAGAIRNALQLIKQQPFLVVNGDVLAKIDLRELMNYHQEERYVATMALSAKAETEGYGMVLLRGERIVKFLKKSSEKTANLINAGFYVFSPEVFDYIPVRGKADLDNDVFPKLVKDGKLAGFTFEGDWYEVSTPRNYEKAIREWRG